MNLRGLLIALMIGFPIFGVGVYDAANTFDPKVAAEVSSLLETFARESGVKVGIRTYLDPSFVPPVVRPTPNEIDITIIRRPYGIRLQIGDTVQRSGWSVEKDNPRLERVIRENFRMGWYDPSLYDVLRLIRNHFLEQSRVQRQQGPAWGGWGIFLVGTALLIAIFILCPISIRGSQGIWR